MQLVRPCRSITVQLTGCSRYHSSSTGYFPVRQAVQWPTLFWDALITLSPCVEETPSWTADTRPSIVRYLTLSAPARQRPTREDDAVNTGGSSYGGAVLTDVTGYVLKLWPVGDELLFGWNVDAHVTGESDWWRGHPDVHLPNRGLKDLDGEGGT